MKFKFAVPILAISLLPACAQTPRVSENFCAGSIPIVSASAPDVKPLPRPAKVSNARKTTRKRTYYRKRAAVRKPAASQVAQKPAPAPLPPIPLPLDPVPPLVPPRLQ